MAKQVEAIIKLQIKAGAANPSPPVGPALGSKGVNIMDFCKQFNARTQEQAEPNRKKVASITWDQVRAIATDKMKDLNAFEIEKAMSMVAGTARSMGITVTGDRPF